MISNLFQNVKKYGFYVRKNKLDGLKYWNIIKNFISQQQTKNNSISKELNKLLGNWNISVKINSKKTSNIDEIYNYIHDEFKIYGEEGDEEKYNITHNLWEPYHFYLQLIRIPKNSPQLNLTKLL